MTHFSDHLQLPPSDAIASLSQTVTAEWFTYPVTAHPHHTDFAGIVWHGSYVAWLEEARIECLRSIGVSFADLVELGYDLPVVELTIRYHLPIRLGMSVLVKTRIVELTQVRVNWDYQIQSLDGQELYATARVTLVAIDREKGKIMRHLPPVVKDALLKLAGG